jgi:hypothetical protein
LEHLQQHDPGLDECDIQLRKDQYQKLKELLLEVDREVTDKLICELPTLAILFSLLTPMDRHRMPLSVYVCNPSSLTIAACLAPTPSSNHDSVCQWILTDLLKAFSHSYFWPLCCFNLGITGAIVVVFVVMMFLNLLDFFFPLSAS